MTTAERPTARPALASLRRARELFLRGHQLPDGVPEEVVAAWKRARFFGVRHDVRESAPPVSPTESPLLAAARPVLERIAPTLDSGQTTLVLTDDRLRVLWATGSAPDHPHHDLSEQAVGHNSAALALHTRRRAEVHGPEHFLDLWQDVSGVSVPVREPETGRLLGTVTVSCGLCAECGPHPGAPVAEAAVIAVEAELLSRSRAAERVLLDAYLRAAGQQGRAVVALDGRNRFVSEAAGQVLSPEELEALEQRVVALVREGTETRIRLSDGPGSVATVTLVPHQGSVIGAVAVLDPAGHTIMSATSRTAVGLAGRSLPWRHAVGRAVELAASPEPLLIVGERGSGKTSLARELVTDPVTVDAAEGELGADLEELVMGRPLLVRHVERLAPSDTATLNSLLDTHPGLPLLVTYTPGAAPGPCLQRLLDTLAARSVTLPALRERPDDIRQLLTSLAPGPTPGHPPLTWTLDALRALERHPWPGNITELAHLVRALTEGRRSTGPVRRTELPDPVREGPAPRPLTPMERAERAAILEALRLNGGNKARTAAALGIGRATLYRKLRGYRG
ncbi:regulator [Streptomyces sp. NBC_00124]|uniref:sigma-54-dependent Fis family transcriptional regulator n=1 Tax=Streptomyces sp. NBC_00124 TaxID=2975662 RepID=UPI00224D0F9F|nr:helix-turn-helix domain-containing protein [Streptomyces sp. NBC_00124]MCX5365665.1 regulator [Streptomyces sp. NBC_00124]